MIKQEELAPNVRAKKAAANAAVKLVRDGMLVGLGTGSTASFFIEALSIRCKDEGLKITAVATSKQSFQLALKTNIPLVDDQTVSQLDLTVDGADEIDHHKNMIKGGGGALLREKLVAKSSHEMVVIVDETKLVENLGAFPVPVEISPFLYQSTLLRLSQQNYNGVLRLNRDQSTYMTDNGTYIFDIQFENLILDPQKEHDKLKSIVGVIETGLFFKIAGRVVIGYQDGFTKIQT